MVPGYGPRRTSSASRQRPASASSSSACSACNVAKGDMGASPWQPLIEGGNHASYSEFGRPQLQPQLGELTCNRTVPPSPALPAGCNHKVSTSEIQSLIESAVDSSADPSQRRLTLCPRMRCKGVCRLPSCPFVHEVCRPAKDFKPLWNANASRSCKTVSCRFMKVMGLCPYADACIYSHAMMSASGKIQPATAVAELSPAGGDKDAPEDAAETSSAQATLTDRARDRPDSSRAGNILRDALGSGPAAPTAARPMRSVGRGSGQGSRGRGAARRKAKLSEEQSSDSGDSDRQRAGKSKAGMLGAKS